MLTVGTLIEALKKLDKDLPILNFDDNDSVNPGYSFADTVDIVTVHKADFVYHTNENLMNYPDNIKGVIIS